MAGTVFPESPIAGFALPQHFHRIFGKYRVLADQNHVLAKGLRDQHAVEGIAMVPGQGCDAPSMRRLDRQPAGAHVLSAPLDRGLPVCGQIETLAADLDGDLPQARGADRDLVTGGARRLACRIAQTLRGHRPPRAGRGCRSAAAFKRSLPSLRAGRQSLRPCAGSIPARCRDEAPPVHRGGPPGEPGARFPLAITISSPSRAYRISFERCVLASWMLTCTGITACVFTTWSDYLAMSASSILFVR